MIRSPDGRCRPRGGPSGLLLIPALLVLALLVLVPLPLTGRVHAQGAAPTAAQPIVLGTTTGLQHSGLLDVLLPQFEQASGRQVTVVAVSSPQALALGARGEVELLLVDAPEETQQFVTSGQGLDRRLVLHSADAIVGPPTDPAGVRTAATAEEALQRIAAAGEPWVSPADNSGQYQRERRLWRLAGLEPAGQGWYVPLGQGLGAVLAAASERQGYALADRAAYLEQRDRLDLAVLAGGFPELRRLYHVVLVSPARWPWLDPDGARALADFLVAPATQETIGRYGAERYGEPVFTPDAGRQDADLVPADPRPKVLP